MKNRGASGIDREEVVLRAEGLAGAEVWRAEYGLCGRIEEQQCQQQQMLTESSACAPRRAKLFALIS